MSLTALINLKTPSGTAAANSSRLGQIQAGIPRPTKRPTTKRQEHAHSSATQALSGMRQAASVPRQEKPDVRINRPTQSGIQSTRSLRPTTAQTGNLQRLQSTAKKQATENAASNAHRQNTLGTAQAAQAAAVPQQHHATPILVLVSQIRHMIALFSAARLTNANAIQVIIGTVVSAEQLRHKLLRAQV